MSIQAIVKRNRKLRNGKGFSQDELKEMGLSFKQALKMGIPIDTRRSTKHEDNMEILKAHLGAARLDRKKQKEVTTPKITLDLGKVKGIGPKLSEKLTKAGIKNANELAASSPEKIAEAISVSETKAATLIENARSLLKE
jgi:large subunit ribosomal protein L13e